MGNAIINSPVWPILKELDYFCLLLNFISDCLMVDYYLETNDDCGSYVDNYDCDIDACDNDSLCIHGWDYDYCNEDDWYQSYADCVCCADVPIRTLYVLSSINLAFLCLWIVICFRVLLCRSPKPV